MKGPWNTVCSGQSKIKQNLAEEDGYYSVLEMPSSFEFFHPPPFLPNSFLYLWLLLSQFWRLLSLDIQNWTHHLPPTKAYSWPSLCPSLQAHPSLHHHSPLVPQTAARLDIFQFLRFTILALIPSLLHMMYPLPKLLEHGHKHVHTCGHASARPHTHTHLSLG